ncbi:hypothetical protein JG687_00006746, partial [Phytophthora cactorum]
AGHGDTATLRIKLNDQWVRSWLTDPACGVPLISRTITSSLPVFCTHSHLHRLVTQSCKTCATCKQRMTRRATMTRSFTNKISSVELHLSLGSCVSNQFVERLVSQGTTEISTVFERTVATSVVHLRIARSKTLSGYNGKTKLACFWIQRFRSPKNGSIGFSCGQ